MYNVTLLQRMLVLKELKGKKLSSYNLHFTASSAPLAQQAFKEFTAIYKQTPLSEAKAIVALGGDGRMLDSMKDAMAHDIPIFGFNFGHVGYLMNPPFRAQDLVHRLQRARAVTFHPLNIQVSFADKEDAQLTAFNDCAVRRLHSQSAHIRIRMMLNGKEIVMCDPLIGDGAVIATPLGSTAYFCMAGGRPIPWSQSVLGIHSICARPKLHKRVSNQSEILIETLDVHKRPVVVSGDNREYANPTKCCIKEDSTKQVQVLFDPMTLLKRRLMQARYIR